MRFDDFARRLIENLELDVNTLVLEPTADLYEDWGLDSFKAFQLIVAVEALAGSMVPPSVLPELYVLGDAYQYYRDLIVQLE